MPKKIYVGNMNYGTTENGLRDLFAQFGEVSSVNIVMDRATGRAKGFGFVEMESDEAAGSAIAKLDGTEFEGRRLRVNEAQERPRNNFEGGGYNGQPRRF